MFEKKVREQEKVIERSESWLLEVDGFDVRVAPPGSESRCRVSIDEAWRRARTRLPSIYIEPKNVDQLEELAERLPAVLRAVAESLRAEGLDDLRSRIEISLSGIETLADAWRLPSEEPK